MALHTYKEKRTFQNTPEPTGGKAKGSKLAFVVQKHHASHLHYDFRLEIRGVLKSWAVPKGPSLDPQVKRLAMLVEDHPYDYKDFEGIIPEGNYGAGTVIIWDQGYYEPSEKTGDKKDQEKLLLKQFYSGRMEITLHGQKLKGRFVIVRAPEKGENSWLLIKQKDSHTRKTDISLQDQSVVSGHTIQTMAGNEHADQWQSNRSAGAAKKKKFSNGTKSGMPSSVRPMLCTPTKEPVIDEQYLYEIKWDGYRIIAYVDGSKVRLDSRSGKDYTKKYPPIVSALKQLKRKVVLDGEIVVFNQEGKPDFDAVQKFNGHDTPISYCVFDILWLDGYDLKDLPLTGRKAILKELIAGNQVLQYSESFEDGGALFEQIKEMGLEGIVAKRKDSTYRENARDNDWLKTAARKRQEFVIGGWQQSDRGRSFKSLLFGAYNNGKLEWIGRSGGGYKEKEMPDILKQLEKIEIEDSPFINPVLDQKGAPVHWVKPQLVANFEFATWTKSGRIRKPATFLGFRHDKNPEQVVREVPKSADQVEQEITYEVKRPATTRDKDTSKESNWRVLEENAPATAENFAIEGCEIPFTDVDRNVWKDIPKASLIQYYHAISGLILPYLKDRPLSLLVKPNGAMAPGLYIKDMEGRQPDCADIFTDHRRHPRKGKRNQIDYLVCNNEATLLYMINLGCIDINPWMSTGTNPDQPDFINIDLDPTGDDFEKVIQVCLAAKEVLAKYKLKSFVKTSGKTGMHIYLPVTGINFAQARSYSEFLGEQIRSLVPEIATTEITISQRGDKVLIDPSQNDYADTLAAPYSARPYKIPTVSTPLDWKEVKAGLDPLQFTIETIPRRIEKKGDLFDGALNAVHQRKNYKALKNI